MPSTLDFNARAGIKGVRVGYFPHWQREATDVDRHALQQLRPLGLEPVEVELPDWPYDSLNAILFAEAGAAFEELTLSGKVDQMRMQTPDAWPNTFRQARFVSAVDFVQADRFRRAVAQEMEKLFAKVDLLLVPSLRDEMLDDRQFHRLSVVDVARGLHVRHSGAQRLGPGPEPAAAALGSTAAHTAQRHPGRAPVR